MQTQSAQLSYLEEYIKNNVVVEFALRDMNKPIGISQFKIMESLPENIKRNLPSIEEIENELKNM